MIEDEDKITIKVYVDAITRENNLINHRLTWLGTFQGLLFAALAFAFDKNACLVYIICVVGLSIGISVGIATKKANSSIDKLKDLYKAETNNADKELLYWGINEGRCFWLMPGSFIPWLISVAWIVIAIIKCFGK